MLGLVGTHMSVGVGVGVQVFRAEMCVCLSGVSLCPCVSRYLCISVTMFV